MQKFLDEHGLKHLLGRVPPNQHTHVGLSELLHVHSCCQVSLQVLAASTVSVQRGATLSLVRVDGIPTGSSGFAATLASNNNIFSIKHIKENLHAKHQTLS